MSLSDGCVDVSEDRNQTNNPRKGGSPGGQDPGKARAPMPLSIPLPRLTGPLPKVNAAPAAQPQPALEPEQPAIPALQALPALAPRLQPQPLDEDSDVEDDAPTSMISMDDLPFEGGAGLGEAQETEIEADVELLVDDDEDEPATTELRPEDLVMEKDEVLTSAPMHAETSGQLIEEELEEEATSLFDSHTSLSEHSPFDSAPLTYDAQPATGALDDYEEEGATIVFDSMSGQKVPAMQQKQEPSQGLRLQHHPQAPSLIQPTPSQGIVDEFSSMSTQLLQSPFEREHLAPKLRVISGPTTNQESFVTGLRSTIGRGEQNSIVIGDAAMSRNHFEIVKNPDESFTLRDLGSANGTQLNGHIIREAALFHGDRIEAGKSVIEFDCPDAPPKPHRHMIAAPVDTFRGQDKLDEKTSLAAFQLDQSTRFFTRVSIGAALVCLPLIGVLIALSLKAPTPAEAQAPPTQQATGQPIPVHKAKAATLYLEGVEAMKARDWTAAESQFKRAKVMDESLDVSAQLELLEREGDAQRALERAKALAAQEKFDEVNAQVDAIPKESVYYAEAQKLRRQQRLGDVADLYKQAQAQLTADELDEAATSIEAILKLSPQHEGAKKLEGALASRREELLKKQKEEEEAAQAANNKGEGKGKLEVDPFGTPSTPRPTSNASASGSLQDGLNLYKRGKFDQAIRALEGVSGPDSGKASKVASQIKQFKSSYTQGLGALKGKSWSKAANLLDKAYKADARINGAYKSELATQLALAHGEFGLSQLRAKKYKDARTELVAGQKIQSKHPKLAELNRELESEATKLYIQAANKKKTDPDAASLLCRQILLMVPFSSPTSKKAQKLLGEL